MSQAIQNAAIALAHAILAEVKMAGGAGTAAPPPPPPPPAAADPFGLGATAGTAAPATPPPVEVTPAMITALIMPLLSNEGAKARLQQAMAGMGISELPAARPDQLPELYTKFKAIADEVNGAAAGGAPAAGGVTII